MKKLTVALASFALAAICTLPVQAADTSGPVTCVDGTTSPHGGKGACSKHGGIKKEAAAATTEAAAPAAAAKTEPAKTAATSGPVTCADGTTSPHGGKGACSKHGGIKKDAAPAKAEVAAPAAPAVAAAPAKAAAAPAAPAAPAAAPKAATAAAPAAAATAEHSVNSDAAGATAKCKDGSYSHSKTHSGTCSKHGGVAEWLDGSTK